MDSASGQVLQTNMVSWNLLLSPERKYSATFGSGWYVGFWWTLRHAMKMPASSGSCWLFHQPVRSWGPGHSFLLRSFPLPWAPTAHTKQVRHLSWSPQRHPVRGSCLPITGKKSNLPSQVPDMPGEGGGLIPQLRQRCQGLVSPPPPAPSLTLLSSV